MLKTLFLIFLTLKLSVENYVDNNVEYRGQRVKLSLFYLFDPLLIFSLWVKKIKFDPCKNDLEGSKNRGQKAPLKRGLFDHP